MKSKLGLPIIAISALLLAVTGCTERENSNASAEETGESRTAVAHLQPTEGNSARGTVTFIQDGDQVRIIADISNISGTHGFHVHENGDCSAPDASSAGGHFNPTNEPHGGPDDEKRHIGDLGNIEATGEGAFRKEWTDDQLRLEGENSIVGKAVVLHAGKDDLTSQPSGDAGPRIACGVIELME